MSIRNAKNAISILFVLAAAAHALPLPQIRVSTAGGALYDLNVLTGTAEMPRATGLGHVVAIDTDTAGRLFSLTSLVGTAPNSFYSINDVTGQATLIGSTGLTAIFEGDLALNPQNGYFYGIQDVPQGLRRFFRIDPTTGDAVTLASLGGIGDFSGLTYGRDNRLFSIDVARDLVFEHHPSTGTILSSVPLSLALDGDVCGMDYDPWTQTIYVAGRTGTTEALFTLDPITGLLTQVGVTGIPNISGLAIIPEPITLPGLTILGIVLLRRAFRSV